MDRRTFLLRSAEATLGATAAGLVAANLLRREVRPWDENAFPSPGDARVAVVSAGAYDDRLEANVLEGLRAVGADLKDRSVLLKPNFVEFDPGSSINTNPRLVAATALALRRLGARTVTVGEGPGHRRDTESVMTRAGLLDVLREIDVPFVDLNTAPIVRVPLRSHYTGLGELWLPQPIIDTDIVVSMPKMKTHHWAGVTLSLKNCFGCVPGRLYGWPKNVLHWLGIDAAILDVAGAVSPSLAIVDGIVGMEGDGPIMGSSIDSGLLVFGDDPVAVDSVTARLMGFDPERLPWLSEAGRFLGQSDPDRVRQEGEDPDRLGRDFAALPHLSYLKDGAPPMAPDGAGSNATA